MIGHHRSWSGRDFRGRPVAAAPCNQDLWHLGRDLGPLCARPPCGFTGPMFVGDEVTLDVSFAVARARLANLTRGGLLASASEDAYALGVTGLSRVGALGLSREVRVQARELTERDDSAGLAIRWEVTGPGRGLFPVLDADVRLLPTG